MSTTKIRTTEEAIDTTVDILAADITTLVDKRDVALNAFHQQLQI